MNIRSDKLNCYLEGIRIPITSIRMESARNKYSNAVINISTGGAIYPKMWANALVQVAYLDQNYLGEKIEKLFFEGMVDAIEIQEINGILVVYAVSKWSILNINSTLDYVAPKRYGINNVDEEITVYLGNEETIKVDNGDVKGSNAMSDRYFYLASEYQDNNKEIKSDSSESFKLQYIIDRTPLAERIAFNLFDQINDNFFVSKAHALRLNLLEKVDADSKRIEISESVEKQTKEDSAVLLGLDISRSGFIYKMTITKKTTSSQGTDVSVSFEDLPSEFIDAVKSMAVRLNTKADWILAVMNFETKGTFRPDIRNPKSQAVGLIQFMPSDAPGDVGKTANELSKMTRMQQLTYVEIYFNRKGKGQLNSLEDVAMTVFYPAAVGNPDYKFPPRVVASNPGIYTPRDYIKKVLLRIKQ